MSKILFSWVGHTDVRCIGNTEQPGPLLTSLRWDEFDRAELLATEDTEVEPYLAWVRSQVETEVAVTTVPLDHPMHLEQLFVAMKAKIEEVRHVGMEATYNMSPGTPAMAVAWLLLAKTSHPARLVRCSLQKGVEEVEVPFDLVADLLPTLYGRVDEQWIAQAVARAHQGPFKTTLWQSEEMNLTVARAMRVAPRNVPVLLHGESGSGKEHVAQGIHEESGRCAGAFHAINCGALSPGLVESELFGHARGAFTGATHAKKGAFALAHGGTLFLDEIGELPLSAQVSLLRVLDQQEVLPVGATQAIPVDVRVIAATHRNLPVEVREGRFRADLYYRLAVSIIEVPPLRGRGGDLSFLIHRLFKKLQDDLCKAEIGYVPKRLSAKAIEKLKGHEWPGNVRELKSTLVRCTLEAFGDVIHAEDVVFLPNLHGSPDRVLGRPMGDGFSIHAVLLEVKRHYLNRALQVTDNNWEKASRLLDLGSGQTVKNWVETVGLSPRGLRPSD